MSELDQLRDHLDRRFGEVHTSLEGIRDDIGDVRQAQLAHAENHAEAGGSKTQTTGIAAVVAVIVAFLGDIFSRKTFGG